ncbi:MAG: hypothetical protein U1F16_08255 [Turneriella sp.]
MEEKAFFRDHIHTKFFRIIADYRLGVRLSYTRRARVDRRCYFFSVGQFSFPDSIGRTPHDAGRATVDSVFRVEPSGPAVGISILSVALSDRLNLLQRDRNRIQQEAIENKQKPLIRSWRPAVLRMNFWRKHHMNCGRR